MNVEGISLAGGRGDTPSTGADSTIILSVVESRARLEKEYGESVCAEVRLFGGLHFTGSQLIVLRYVASFPCIPVTHTLHEAAGGQRHHIAEFATLLTCRHSPPLGL